MKKEFENSKPPLPLDAPITLDKANGFIGLLKRIN